MKVPILLLAIAVATAGKAAVLTPLADIPRRYSTPDFEWAALSPDGATYAHSAGGGISFEPADSKGPSSYTKGLAGSTLLQFGSEGPLAIKWAETSDAVWTATWPWPKGVMQPVRAALNGAVQSVPTPPSGSYPLDGLLFVNGKGLAIASYATRGHLIDVKTVGPPILALVDLASAKTLASIRLDRPFGVEGRTVTLRGGPQNAAVTEAKDGSVRFVADVYTSFSTRRRQFHPMFMAWNTTGAARLIRSEYAGAGSRFAISPDGSKILVARRLFAFSPCPVDAPCSKPAKPVNGVSVALYDFTTGKRLWQRVEKDVVLLRPARPLFSPDGRFAMVAMPQHSKPIAGKVRPSDGGRVGIIAVRDGRLIEAADTHSNSMILQLMKDQNTLFVQAGDRSQLFRVNWDEARRMESASIRRRGRQRAESLRHRNEGSQGHQGGITRKSLSYTCASSHD